MSPVMTTLHWDPDVPPYQGPVRLSLVWPLAGPFGALLLAAMAIMTLH